MTQEEATEIIEACAEADFGSWPDVDTWKPSDRTMRGDVKHTLDTWMRMPEKRDNVTAAVDTLGIERATDVYVKAICDLHADEYKIED